MSGGWLSRDGKRHGINVGCDVTIYRECDSPPTTWITVSNIWAHKPRIISVLGQIIILHKSTGCRYDVREGEYIEFDGTDWKFGSISDNVDQVHLPSTKKCTCGTHGTGICSDWCDLVRSSP